MIEIGGLLVTDSWTEWAVEPFDGSLLYCDTLDEAEVMARLWEKPVLKRRYYVTEWEETQ